MRARLLFLVTFTLCICAACPADAAPPGVPDAAYMQQIVEQAFQLTHTGARYVAIRNEDLEQEFSAVAGSVQPVLFYEIRWGTPAAGNNQSIWAITPDFAGRQSYQIFHFESSDGLDQITREFNRLMAHLTRPIASLRLPGLAGFFLSCCVRGDDGEVVTDDESVRHAVERYYLGVFGDTPRMLSAYAQWWEAYRSSGIDLAPSGSAQQIAVKRIVLASGTHPQLQQWDIVVSTDGSVRIASFEPVFFPRGDHWVFYDFQSAMRPFRPGATRTALPAFPVLPTAR